MGKKFEEEDEDLTIVLTLDDDTELECSIVTILEVEGKEYIALLPLEGADAEDGIVYIYGYSETEDGEPELRNIVDEEEYDLVSDAFDEYLDGTEFDELVTEDED